MVKIYSDEEIERLSKNPNVYQVNRNGMALTLEFRQRLYDEWVMNPFPSTVKKLLTENGFNVSDVGSAYHNAIAKNFKEHGRPKLARSLPLAGEPVKKSAGSKEQPDQPEKTPASEKSGLEPDVVSRMFTSYPEIPVQEALVREGFSLDETGLPMLQRLEKTFALERSIGTAPYESREPGEPVSLEDVHVLRDNPFVESAVPLSIRMSRRFFMAAAVLRWLPVDQIFDIFMIDHKYFTLNVKHGIKKQLWGTRQAAPGTEAFGGTVYDAIVLRRRMAALHDMASEGFREIASLLPSMSRFQKKQLCVWIQGLPADPGHEFTLKDILGRVGITRSVYYLYVGDPEFGMSEIRRREMDGADAGMVKEAFDYKGFRKGARQVYMLLPRITGKKLSLKRIRRIMKEHGMECGVRKRNPARESRVRHAQDAIKPNLLRRRFRLHRPNEVRVTDVTCLDYGDGMRAYGSALMDPVTGRLLAFVVSEKNNLEMAIETLRSSDSHPCGNGGIFHSDQGVLYQSDRFQEEVLERGLGQSMSKKGNCWDNAAQESFFGHFKDECEYSSCENIEELKKKVEEFSWYYNNERGMWDRCRMTPVEYEKYLLGLSEEEFGLYLEAEEKKYKAMKEKAAELARKRYGTLGV